MVDGNGTGDGEGTSQEPAQTNETTRKSAPKIEELRRRAEAALTQAEEAARKANSESGFAFNAKGNAEEHAKAIAQIRGTVEATFSGLSATKSKTDEIEQAIVAARVAAESALSSVEESTNEVTRRAAEVKAASERVDAVLPSIEQGSRDANAITAAKAGAEAAAAAIQSLQTQMSDVSAQSRSDAAAVASAHTESKEIVASMEDARNTAVATNERLNEYEAEIRKMTSAFEAMEQKLEGLLPHATSAGLASAFHIQKARFSKPQFLWLALFVLAIISLIAAAFIGFGEIGDTWDAMLRRLVNRLPIVAPLIWDV